MRQSLKTICLVWVWVAALPAYASQIAGHVYDYYGTTPIAGVRVVFVDYTGESDTEYAGVTGADGAFTVSLPGGKYLGAANPNGSQSRYIPQFYGGVNAAYWSPALTVEDSAALSDINFYLWSGFRVSGAVSSPDGNPGETELFIYDQTTGLYYWGLTGASTGAGDGSFSVNLPQGVYMVLSYPAGSAIPGELFPLLVNDDVSDLTIHLPATASVSGRVTSADRGELESIRVDAIDAENGYSYGYATTDDTGVYRIERLPAGREYRVLARTAFHPEGNYYDLPGTFYPDKTRPEDAALVYVSDAGVNNIDITVPDTAGTISGKVTDTQGNPIKGAYVYDYYYPGVLNPYVAIGQHAAYTDDNGHFTIYGVGPATVGVAATASEYVPQLWNGRNMSTVLTSGDSLDIAAGDALENIDFELASVYGLGDAPYVSSISPHLVIRGQPAAITVSGGNFQSGASVDVVDIYPLHLQGELPVVTSFSVAGGDTVEIHVTTTGATALGPYYFAVTNPDGQYDMVGFTVIAPEPSPRISILASPERFNPQSTWSVGWNMQNLSTQPETVDVYVAVVLPTSDAVFYDGEQFSLDVLKMYDTLQLTSGYFLAQSLLVTLPLNGADLPPGEYIWVDAVTRAGTFDIIDFSMKSLFID